MTHYKQQKEYLEEELEYHFVAPTFKLIDILLEKNVIEDDDLSLENTIVTSSSGISVTIIFRNKDKVYQLFSGKSVYERIKSFCEAMASHYGINDYTKYIVKHREFFDEIYGISFDKIEPINNFTFDPQKMKTHVQCHRSMIEKDISKALSFFHEYMNASHGDCRIDNIGYNWNTSTYVLFDYDKSSLDSDLGSKTKDLTTFQDSLKLYS